MRTVTVLAVAVFAAAMCYGQRGRGAGGGGHMGGGASSIGRGAGRESAEVDRRGPAANSDSRGRSPEQALESHARLSSNLEKMLPGGTSAKDACGGFKNLGQCVAAVHVSHNLGIPFSDLKGRMTGANSEDLGKAIQDLKPGADAKAEKKRAEKQAKADLGRS